MPDKGFVLRSYSCKDVSACHALLELKRCSYETQNHVTRLEVVYGLDPPTEVNYGIYKDSKNGCVLYFILGLHIVWI